MSEKKERINSVPKKLLAARASIKKTKMKKGGTNDYSKYDYFTPDQVANLVNAACQKEGLLTMFNLEKDDIGYFGRLLTTDVDTGDVIESVMRTEIPEIKATNATQKMGGAYTYTKRYMLMNEFDIADNNLDFDAQDNRPSKAKAVSEAKPQALLKKKAVAVAEEAKEPLSTPKKEKATPKKKPSLKEAKAKLDAVPIEINAPEEVVDMAMQKYLEKIEAYTDHKVLAAESKGIVADAELVPVSEGDVILLKETMTDKFKTLKANVEG